MKILLLATHLNTGGITQYLLTLAKGFRAQGHMVAVASSGGNMVAVFEALGVDVLTLNLRTKSIVSPKLLMSLRPLKQYVEAHDIEVIHAQTRVTQMLGQCLKMLTGRVFVSTCHGFFRPRLVRRCFPFWGDGVIAISEQVQAHLQDDFNVPLSNIALIKSGITLQDFACPTAVTRQAARELMGVPLEVPLIGMIARLSDVKGQDVLVRAMKLVVAQYPTVQLVLVGQGKLEGLVQSLIDELSLSGHVRICAIMNQPAKLLPAFDIFAMPSRQEGLGLSVMEAQAAGIPVVASRVGGILSLIEDGHTGVLVSPDNETALAEGLVNLLTNNEQRKEISVQAYAQAQAQYSDALMVDKTLAFYEKNTRC